VFDHAEDGKLRTDHFTEAAVQTIFGIAGIGGMIALGIEFVGHGQNVARAIVDAEFASLAAFSDDIDLAARDELP